MRNKISSFGPAKRISFLLNVIKLLLIITFVTILIIACVNIDRIEQDGNILNDIELIRNAVIKYSEDLQNSSVVNLSSAVYFGIDRNLNETGRAQDLNLSVNGFSKEDSGKIRLTVAKTEILPPPPFGSKGVGNIGPADPESKYVVNTPHEAAEKYLYNPPGIRRSPKLRFYRSDKKIIIYNWDGASYIGAPHYTQGYDLHEIWHFNTETGEYVFYPAFSHPDIANSELKMGTVSALIGDEIFFYGNQGATHKPYSDIIVSHNVVTGKNNINRGFVHPDFNYIHGNGCHCVQGTADAYPYHINWGGTRHGLSTQNWSHTFKHQYLYNWETKEWIKSVPLDKDGNYFNEFMENEDVSDSLQNRIVPLQGYRRSSFSNEEKKGEAGFIREDGEYYQTPGKKFYSPAPSKPMPKVEHYGTAQIDPAVATDIEKKWTYSFGGAQYHTAPSYGVSSSRYNWEGNYWERIKDFPEKLRYGAAEFITKHHILILQPKCKSVPGKHYVKLWIYDTRSDDYYFQGYWPADPPVNMQHTVIIPNEKLFYEDINGAHKVEIFSFSKQDIPPCKITFKIKSGYAVYDLSHPYINLTAGKDLYNLIQNSCADAKKLKSFLSALKTKFTNKDLKEIIDKAFSREGQWLKFPDFRYFNLFYAPLEGAKKNHYNFLVDEINDLTEKIEKITKAATNDKITLLTLYDRGYIPEHIYSRYKDKTEIFNIDGRLYLELIFNEGIDKTFIEKMLQSGLEFDYKRNEAEKRLRFIILAGSIEKNKTISRFFHFIDYDDLPKNIERKIKINTRRDLHYVPNLLKTVPLDYNLNLKIIQDNEIEIQVRSGPEKKL